MELASYKSLHNPQKRQKREEEGGGKEELKTWLHHKTMDCRSRVVKS